MDKNQYIKNKAQNSKSNIYQKIIKSKEELKKKVYTRKDLGF